MMFTFILPAQTDLDRVSTTPGPSHRYQSLIHLVTTSQCTSSATPAVRVSRSRHVTAVCFCIQWRYIYGITVNLFSHDRLRYYVVHNRGKCADMVWDLQWDYSKGKNAIHVSLVKWLIDNALCCSWSSGTSSNVWQCLVWLPHSEIKTIQQFWTAKDPHWRLMTKLSGHLYITSYDIIQALILTTSC